MRVFLYAVALALSMAIPAQASPVTELKGETTIGSDVVQVLSAYPAGRIVDLAHKDDIVAFVGVVGDLYGNQFNIEWLKIKTPSDQYSYGYLDRSTTTYFPFLILDDPKQSADSIQTTFIDLQGTTTIMADIATVRVEYPDGRVVKSPHKGEKLDVVGAVIDVVDNEFYVKWLKVKSTTDKNIEGFVDAEQTNYRADMRMFRLSSPVEKR